MLLDFNVKTGTKFSLPDKRLFEISVVEITRVNCNYSWLGQHIFLQNIVDKVSFVTMEQMMS